MNAPGGFSRDTSLLEDETFAITDGDSIMDVLASWVVDPASCLESINDLAVDGAGRLHALSSQSRCLARLDSPMRPEDSSVALTAWPLPTQLFHDEEDHAEGLVFTPEAGWLVALDLKRFAPNVFQLLGIPGADGPEAAANGR